MEREELEKIYGEVYDTKQVQEKFKIDGFMAPWVMCTRKSDGVSGIMTFQHSPRYYFEFIPE